MSKGKKKYYSREFKEEAVKLVTEQGYRISEAANSLGVSESAIRKWKGQLDPNSNNVDCNQHAEIQRLKKEVKRLRMEREILKKAAAFFAKETL
ncbi:MAG: transposase [Proteobacteria bacterium]|nr:transposase [Pseudomonadota bacterium]